MRGVFTFVAVILLLSSSVYAASDDSGENPGIFASFLDYLKSLFSTSNSDKEVLEDISYRTLIERSDLTDSIIESDSSDYNFDEKEDLPYEPTDGEAPIEIYVSPNGDDGNEGSFEFPLQTISAAQDKVRSMNDNMESDIIVYLRAGKHVIDDTIVFTPEDSGTSDFKVIYQGYPGEKAMITTLQPITGWWQSSFNDRIYVANIDDADFRHLYYDGGNKRAIRSRSPNIGDGILRIDEWDHDTRTLLIPENHLVRNNGEFITDPETVEMVIPSLLWSMSRLRLGTVESEDNDLLRFTPQEREREMEFCKNRPNSDPCGTGFTHIGPFSYDGQAYYLENSIFFVDSPTEWYIQRYDDYRDKVFFYAPDSVNGVEDMEALEVSYPKGSVDGSSIETLILIEGTENQPVMNLEFNNLLFFHTSWLYPSQNGYVGFNSGRASYLYDLVLDDGTVVKRWRFERLPAAVETKYAQDITIRENFFGFLGATGLKMKRGSKHILVEGNAFTNIASGGISLDDDFWPVAYIEEQDIIEHVVITDNIMRFIGQDYGGDGIIGGAVRNVDIVHNDIKHVATHAIKVGTGGHLLETFARKNVISGNKIYNVMNRQIDGGAIYTSTFQPGLKITNNFVEKVRNSGLDPRPHGTSTGIYLDIGSQQTLVEDNLLVDVDTAFNLNCQRQNNVLNNFYNDVLNVIRIRYSGCSLTDPTGENRPIPLPAPTQNEDAPPLFYEWFPGFTYTLNPDEYTTDTVFEGNEEVNYNDIDFDGFGVNQYYKDRWATILAY